MAQASAAASSGRNDPAGTKLPEIARDYNFAADILQSNLAAGRANKPAFIDANGSWTYGQLADRAARFGAMLRAKGIRREERILICLLDTIDWPTAFLGALKAGVVAIPVNTLMTESDYEFMLSDSRARMLVVSEALYPKFAELIARKSDLAPDLAHVVVSGTNAHGHDHFETLIAASPPEDYTAPTTRDDIAFWLYTSGSTGKPKGAVHVHASLKLTNDLYAVPILGLREDDVCYSVAKLFFAYGLGNAMTFPMSAGATTILLADRPTPDGVAALLRKHPVTIFFGVPTFYAGFLASPGMPDRTETHFRRCVSAGEALAGRCRQALERDLRLRHSRRHRLDRDASHLPVECAGCHKIRHHRQAGPRLHAEADRRPRTNREAGRDGRIAHQRTHRRGHVLEQP